jgi:hypothetical protein
MTRLYGLLVELDGPEALRAAAESVAAAGYKETDAYGPFPVEGVSESLGFKRSRVPLLTLLGGIAGGAGAYFMQWYAAVVSYPIDVGGRPYHSVPSFVPVTFELTVLGAATTAVLVLIFGSGLPKLYHPVFNVPAFQRASRDRFFLCVRADDTRFDATETRRFLERVGGEAVHEVPA